jgi:hypothetical protein
MSLIEDFIPYFTWSGYDVPVPYASENIIKTLKASNMLKFDYKNKKMLYHIYWKDKTTPIHIAYDNTLKLNKIKKVLDTIPAHEFQIKKILIKAEKQLRFLRNIYCSLSLIVIDVVKYKPYINQCVTDFANYLNSYNYILGYYNMLPEYKEKYSKLLEVAKSRNMCRTCFKYSENIKRNKHGNICIECFKIKTLKNTIHECPICIESYSMDNFIGAKCGNGHYICKPCFITLCNYSNKCPLCRGEL